LAAGERALPRPPVESARGKGRKEDWRRERGGLDWDPLPRFMQIAATDCEYKLLSV